MSKNKSTGTLDNALKISLGFNIVFLLLALLSTWFAYQANSESSKKKIIDEVTKQVTLEKEVESHKQQIKELEDKMYDMNKMYISLDEKISELAGKAKTIDRQLMQSTIKALMLTGKSYQESIQYWNTPIQNINPKLPEMIYKNKIKN